MRSLFRNYGFTVSVLVAVATTALFVFVFGASPELVANLLALGFATALAEYFFRSSSKHEP